MKRAMLIGLMLVIPGVVEGGLILPTGEGGPVFEWEAWFEFYVYLQVGSTGPDAGQGSGSHERGDFVYSIPLVDGHPWVLRTDHGSYINYKVDDCGTGITSHDDLELNISYDESGQPLKLYIIQASGNYTASQSKQFICDFMMKGEVIVKDWSGMENPDRMNHFGETIIVPEPASLALLVLGGLGLLARRSGRKV